MPMIPFMGVRISWLMLARNSLLAMLAISAWEASEFARAVASSRNWFVARRASSVSFCAVTLNIALNRSRSFRVSMISPE